MKRITLFILLALYLTINVYSQNGLNDLNVIFKHDFENNTPGIYLVNEWKRDWLNPPWSNRQSSTNIVQDVNDEINPTKALQINFPAGTVGADENGATWYTFFDKMDEIYVSYDLMFMPGFQFKLGGKIPSVEGGTVNAGVKPTGYDGFTGGLMFKENGRINFYIYFPDSKQPLYGDSFRWGGEYTSKALLPSSVVAEFSSTDGAYCSPGTWHNITYRMVLNTIKSGGGGNYDGILEAYFDGKLVLQLSHFLFRQIGDLGIDCMRLYSFFGGSGDDWRTPINEWLKVDNVILYTFNENVKVPRGNVLSPTDRTINYWRNFSVGYTKAPGAPSTLTSNNINKSSISLKWTDNSNNEQGFKINRSISPTEGFVEIGNVPANVTTFTNNSLTPGTAYYYRVMAFNTAGTSNYSNVLSTSTLNLQLPIAPTGLIASHIDYTLATVLWTDKSNNETSFELERSGPNDPTIKKIITVPTNSVSYTDKELAMKSTYQYRIRARNIDGISAWTSLVEIVTQWMAPPVAPTELKSTKFTDNSISVSWNDNSSNEDAFIINRALATDPTSAVVISVTANDTAYTDSLLTSSTTYQYTIKAINKGGNSSLSNKNVATTLSHAESKRVKDGLVAYYNFGYNPDYIIYDQSGFGEPVNLHVLNRSAIEWNNDNTMDILSNTVLVSIMPAIKITQAIKKTNELTFECWIKPMVPDFSGNSRILSFASNDAEVGFLLDQDLSGNPDNQSLTYSVRVQTESTNPSGYPEFIPDLTQPYINLQHLLYVRDSLGKETMYLNGVKSSEGFRPSDLGNWKDDFYLRVGNESDMNHSWKGSYYSVAIYNKALSKTEVLTNYHAGPSDSIENLAIDYRVEVYPNPVTDRATIKITPEEITDYVPQTTIQIVDIYGKVIYSEPVFNPNSQYTKSIDLRHVPPGMYFLQVTSGKKQNSTKLVVQR